MTLGDTASPPSLLLNTKKIHNKIPYEHHRIIPVSPILEIIYINNSVISVGDGE